MYVHRRRSLCCVLDLTAKTKMAIKKKSYTRENLLQLRYTITSSALCKHCKHLTTKQQYKKREADEVVCKHVLLRKRPNRPSRLPTAVVANVQSLGNQLDELHLNCKHDHVFREASVGLLGFRETGLDS